jgi:CRISPR-associated protein Csd1
MMLQGCLSYYEVLASKGEIARPGWGKGKVSYALEIDEQGQLLAVHPLKVSSQDGKKMLPREMQLPERVKRSVGVHANFLCDNATYFLGIGDENKPERVKDCFEAAKSLHLSLLSECEENSAQAVCVFFQNWDISGARENPMLLDYLEDLDKGGNLVFMLATTKEYPQDNAKIATLWQNDYDQEDQGEKMPCLVTGKLAIPTAIHPAIKGVIGAQAAGAALVSFNAPAYCSFGREQNFNAPVSKYAAFAYTTVLNHLLADKKHTARFGETTVVYWAEDAESKYQDAFSYLLNGDENTMLNEDLDAAIKAITNGIPANWDGIPLKPDNRFYVLGLSPNAARLSVRFFLCNSFGTLVKNVSEHDNRLEIVRDNRSKFQKIPLWALLRETVNEKSKDKAASPQMAGDMLRAILTGGRYPATLYQQTQLRIRAERVVTRGRAAIIKAYLLKNTDDNKLKEALTVELNEQTSYQPYILGRLFAVLVEVQEKASNVTSIKDKYFSSACATPAVIFPMILNLADKHLRKFDEKGRIYYAKKIGELMGRMTESFPNHQTLNEQGIFQLGYYHQVQKRYEKKEVKELKEEENNVRAD